MTCNDCIHYGLCDCGCGFGVCRNFKDKSKFLEIPLKPGDKAYLVALRTDLTCYICHIEVFTVTFDSNNFFVTASQCHGDMNFVYGKDVFSTIKEAEQRLEELENE